MNPSGRKNAKPSSPPVEQTSGTGEGLLTSEDLFGDMVDAPPPEPVRAEKTGPTRKDPIRVQVCEPGTKAEAAKPGPRAGEVLPEDVAALLDAFSGPVEDAAHAAAAVPPAAKPTTAATSTPPGTPTPAGKPKPTLPPAAGPGGAEKDEYEMLALLDEIVEAAPPAAADSAPRPADSLLEVPGLEELVNAKANDLAAAPEAAKPLSHNSLKFQAAAPDKGPIGERVALDLAGLAADAFTNPVKPGEAGPATFKADQTYGPYRLLEKVAVGGMAEVFRAKRSGVEGFEKVVAVKRILPHLSDNKEFVDMFIDEAKMVAGLTHPNIVQIFDLGKIEKTYYIAMEYVHGRDLRSIMKRAKERGIRIPLDISTHIVGKVGAALEYAHRKKDEGGRPMRIVHRDVSPQNILISFEGDVKITDFGIAKAATKASNTERGALRGKLLYMSPEQAWGKSIDKRSDIFSLGIVLFEMLTEDKPFLGSSEVSILEMVRDCRVAAPTTLNPRIPEKLERAAIKALEKDPEQRYQDAGELARDLDRALADRKPPTSAELARFLEVLFDPNERGVVAHDEHNAWDHRPSGSGPHLEVEFEQTPAGEKQRPAPAPVPVTKDISIDNLLKRFGIK
jgi:serine/threonine protein kinase